MAGKVRHFSEVKMAGKVLIGEGGNEDDRIVVWEIGRMMVLLIIIWKTGEKVN